MAASIIYEMSFMNVEETLVTVLISDNAVQTEDAPEIIQLDPAGSPLRILTIDEGENKFTPIKSQQATITFLSNGSTSLQTFSDGADDRFSVSVLYGTTIVFLGFLSLSDNSEAFLPPKNQVVLTANDKLGALKEIPLTDFDGESVEGVNPQGKYKIGQLIAMCLQKTGLSLELRVINNLRHEGSTGHIYDETYLDVKTFEEEIGISENCYTVLEKILGFDCFITQYKECWWICRVDEYDSNDLNVYRFDEDGELIDSYIETTLSKSIGFNETHWLSDEATIVQPMRPIGFSKLTYNFEYPQEIVCNQDFERGTGTAADDTNPNQTIELVPECWEPYSHQDNTFTDFPPTAGASLSLVKRFEYGYEKDKYLKILNDSANLFIHYYKSPAIRVSEKDKVDMSFDFRLSPASSPLDVTVAYVLLFADNGDIYQWKVNDGVGGLSNVDWIEYTGGATFVSTWTYFPDGVQNMNDWTQMSATSYPIPAVGSLYIILSNSLVNPNEVHFSNLQVTFQAFTNGSYRAYNGRYEKVSTALTGYLANIDEEVFISDAERELFKGAMLKQGSGPEIYSGVADFGNFGDIQIDGDVEDDFIIGTRIVVSGSANNNITATIISTNYSIIGDLTTITTDGATVTEINATIVINEVAYVLTDRWYDASKYTIGDPGIVIQPYGWHQAYAVWNQYRLANRIFQYQFQGFGADIPSLVHKYTITDVSGHSENRNFLMLTKDADLFLCNQTGVLEQVYHSEEGKIYTDEHEFKYIS